MKIISVVGTRPNFIKIAPFCEAIKKYADIEHILIHTGQHYDFNMSDVFFNQLNIKPDICLNIKSNGVIRQQSEIMIAFEKVLLKQNPDWVVVVGDVNSTVACSIVAAHHNIKICHIEAGIRSFDMSMPEEINRIITDSLSSLLLTHSDDAMLNLYNEGVDEKKCYNVGNIMIDSLKKAICNISKKTDNDFIYITMHRQSNVDNKLNLTNFVNYFIKLDKKIIWSLHPRTKKMLKKYNLLNKLKNAKHITLLEPLSYIENLQYIYNSKLVITDSGGIQEETSYIRKPCITIRNNTERPITLLENGGTSVLTGNSIDKLNSAINKMYNKIMLKVQIPLWDGKTADRCIKKILIN